jgi:hypothetical protein
MEAFRHAVDTMIMAQEIIVDNASYPPKRSPGIRTATGRWAWASPTSARC